MTPQTVAAKEFDIHQMYIVFFPPLTNSAPYTILFLHIHPQQLTRKQILKETPKHQTIATKISLHLPLSSKCIDLISKLIKYE